MCFFSNGEVFSEALKHISHHITLVRTVPVSKPIASRGNGFSPDWLAEEGFQQNKIRPLGTRRDRKRPRFALLLLLSRFSRVRLCATPETAAHQAPHPWDSPGKNTGVGCHFLLQCMEVKRESEVAQLRLTLSDPMDCSPPGSSVHGIFQARALEWVTIAFSVDLV